MNAVPRAAVLAALAVAALAGGAEGRSACRLLLDDIEPDLAALDDGIADPPPTAADAAKVKAVASGLAALAKARAKRTPDAAVKAAGRIAKLLGRAFGEDAAAAAVVQDLADGMPTCLESDLDALGSATDLLPLGKPRALVEIKAVLAEAALFAVTAFPPADAGDLLRALKRPAKHLRAAQVRHRKAVSAVVGAPGLRVDYDETLARTLAADHVTLTTTGAPSALTASVVGDLVSDPIFGGDQAEVVQVALDPAGDAPLAPGAFDVDGTSVVVAYHRVRISDGFLLSSRFADSGTVALLLFDEETGTAAGTFDVAIDGYFMTGGTFHVSGGEIGEPVY